MTEQLRAVTEPAPGGQPIDSTHFRQVLSQFPTGVAAITSLDQDGNPLGMIVGTFMSVSLDPPLVGFLPDRKSTSWPRIEATGRFCVNVLGANQEKVCRALAAKTEEKFTELRWAAGRGGLPVLDGVVAWIDCTIESVTDAGDHVMVMGRVHGLDVAGSSLPLLFFRGGYGRFAPHSLAANDSDLVDQLRLVDLTRGQLESLAVDLETQVTAVVRVGDSTVLVASAGELSPDLIEERGLTEFPFAPPQPTPVGSRFSFAPPLGSVFAAWGGEHVRERWLAGSAQNLEQHAMYVEVTNVVRARGYSVGLSRVSDESDLSGFIYNPAQLPSDGYEFRQMSAPIFDATGEVALEFTVWGPPGVSTPAEIETYAARLLEATSVATELVGGTPLPPGSAS